MPFVSTVLGPIFGHAGDGNFHCILLVSEDDDEDYRRRVEEVGDRLVRATLAAGGTCTGEHGVGIGKIKYLRDQCGEGGLAMMAAVKKALDPHGIFNPGKILEHVP